MVNDIKDQISDILCITRKLTTTSSLLSYFILNFLSHISSLHLMGWQI